MNFIEITNRSSDALANIEEMLFAQTQSFMSRLEEISLQPITNEANVLTAKAAMDKLTNDMQAFSNSLILEKGPSSGILLSGTPLGKDFVVAESYCSAAA